MPRKACAGSRVRNENSRWGCQGGHALRQALLQQTQRWGAQRCRCQPCSRAPHVGERHARQRGGGVHALPRLKVVGAVVVGAGGQQREGGGRLECQVGMRLGPGNPAAAAAVSSKRCSASVQTNQGSGPSPGQVLEDDAYRLARQTLQGGKKETNHPVHGQAGGRRAGAPARDRRRRAGGAPNAAARHGMARHGTAQHSTASTARHSSHAPWCSRWRKSTRSSPARASAHPRRRRPSGSWAC